MKTRLPLSVLQPAELSELLRQRGFRNVDLQSHLNDKVDQLVCEYIIPRMILERGDGSLWPISVSYVQPLEAMLKNARLEGKATPEIKDVNFHGQIWDDPRKRDACVEEKAYLFKVGKKNAKIHHSNVPKINGTPRLYRRGASELKLCLSSIFFGLLLDITPDYFLVNSHG